MKIFEVCDGEKPEIMELKMSTRDRFEEAVALFNDQKLRDAETIFQECLRNNPDDKAAQIYLVRCQGLLRYG